ncbi:hypothetical protein PV762_01230 [Mitsuaria sp. CC2]|uniref:hypothetical protein n=1 Tax=Mitsuaria sp. CC2 TaxID=3029186 RepID=UPI003B8C23CD
MSRSIHRTTKSVFHLKSRAEVEALCDSRAPDPDVAELLKKWAFKRASIRNRKVAAAAASEPVDPEGNA